MKEKILFFHLLNNFTGSPQVLRNTILLARDMGKEVHLYTSSTEGFLSGIQGIAYHSNGYFRSGHRVITLFSFFLSQLFLAFRLLKYRKDSCTFFINTILPFSSVCIGKLLRKRVIVHVHESEISPKILNRFLFRIVRTYADQVLVVSEFLGKNQFLYPRSPRVIYNSVKKEFQEQGHSQVLVREDFRVLMLASLRPYKGIYEFSKLAKEMPDIRFDLILSDSEQEVLRWKKEVNPTQNLFIWPVQRDVIPFYQKASLVLNLAHQDKWKETFGMTVLEGMHFGLPSIVPTEGGITELVLEGINGFRRDYLDLDGIKLLIDRMKSDTAFWSRLSLQALERARLFSSEIFNREMKKILE